jgi:hypothetical protein
MEPKIEMQPQILADFNDVAKCQFLINNSEFYDLKALEQGFPG